MSGSAYSNLHSGRIFELDALRGFAATSVVIFHLGPAAGLPTPTGLGQYGVSLFFIISGFVITMTTSKGGGRKFIASRVARLYPTYWSAILITSSVAFLLETHPPGLRTILINLPMIQPVLKTAAVDSVYWTLAVEMQFYALMAALLWAGLIKRADIFIAAALLTQLICRMFDIGPSLPWYYAISGDCYLFAVGVAIYQIASQTSSRWTVAILILAPMVSSFDRLDRLPSEAGLAVLVWLATSGKLPVLRWTPLVYIGSISYPLYLIHDRIGRDLLHRFLGARALQCAIVVIFVGLIAAAVHHAIEEPLRPRVNDYCSKFLSRVQIGGTPAAREITN